MKSRPQGTSRRAPSVWRGGAWPGRRLALAISLVAVLAVAVGILLAVESYRHAQHRIEAESGKLAEDTATEAATLAGIRIEYLRGIAASKPVVEGNRAAMRPFFEAMLGRHVVLDDIGWVRADGKEAVTLSRPPAASGRIDLSDRVYVRRVRQTQEPYVSDVVISKQSGRPVVVIAVPSFNRHRAMTGLVTGILRLDQLRPALRTLRAGETVRLYDRVGHLVVAETPTRGLQMVRNTVLFRRMQQERAGVLDGRTGLDGSRDQLIGFASEPVTGWTVVVSEPTSVAFAGPASSLRASILRWLALLAAVVVVALYAGRRFDRSTRERVTRTDVFVEAAGRMTAATTVAEIADIYTGAIRRTLGAASATVAVVESNELVPYFAPGTRDELFGRRLPWESPPGAAIVTRGRVQVRTPEELGERFPLVARLVVNDPVPVLAVAAVPLPAVSQVRGATAAVFDVPRVLTEPEWLLLEAYARHVAQALERAQLYEAERRQRLRAEEAERREHGVAVRLQRALLPDFVVSHPRLEVVARYQAGAEHLAVGGDWYDTFALPDGRIAFTVGDVAGHGVDAAAAMGRIRSAVRAFAHDVAAPDELLTRLDAFVAELGDVDLVTLTHCVLDPGSGRLEYASAGHPPSLLLDPDGTARFLDGGRSPVLPGFPPGGRRARATTTLEPGARLVLYTDGLVERRGEVIDVGLAHLRAGAEALHGRPAEAFADGLLRELGRSGGYSDDVALLVLDLLAVADDPATELIRRARSLRTVGS